MQSDTSRTSVTETSQSSLINAAHAYALLGWPVFPLAPREKIPLYRNPHPRGTPERGTCRGYRQCGRFGHGVLDATLDPDVIDHWWTRHPHAGIGMACGITRQWSTDGGRPLEDAMLREAPDVLDIDVKDGAPGVMSRERLRVAGYLSGCVAQVRTPSGGEHLYYEATTQGNGMIKKAGVDFRSAGGYVVLPPTEIWIPPASSTDPAASPADDVPGVVRAYRWLVVPRLATGSAIDWTAVKTFLQPPHLRAPREPGRPHSATGVDALCRWLAGEAEGGRNAALHWACCKALESDAGADLEALGDVGRQIGLTDHEVRKTIGSARNKVLLAVGDR